MIQRFLLAALSLGIAGCLKTAAEVRDEAPESPQQRQVVQQQRDQAREVKERAAPGGYRFEEVDEQMRQMNGRIDLLENRIAQTNAAQQGGRENEAKEKIAQSQRLMAYEEALRKMEIQIQTLNQEVERLKAPPPAPPVATGKGHNAYEEGEELFNSKKYKEAIVAYQKYRDTNPKGKNYSDATYKMGLAFQEIGMKDEAKVFFEEVREKFPNSKEAKKAAFRMKSLK